MAIPADSLKDIPYFRGLKPHDLDRVRERMFEERLERNQVLFLEGDEARALYVVRSGRIKIFKVSPEGKEQVLRVMESGDTFNEVPVFDGGANPASAQAMEPAVVYGIRCHDMLGLIRGHPEIALGVLKVFATRLRHFTRMVEDLSFRSVTSRVAKILLEMAESAEGGAEAAAPKRPFTQQELAAMVGTAREMVGRAFKALERAGAIRMDRHRIVVLDREVLRRMI